MPGLSVNTDGTGIPQTPVPVPVPNIAGYTPLAPPTGVPSSTSSSSATAAAPANNNSNSSSNNSSSNNNSNNNNNSSSSSSSSNNNSNNNNRPQPPPRAITTSQPQAPIPRAAPAPAAVPAPPPRAPAVHAAVVPAPATPGPSAAPAAAPAESSSPTRPPVSPITPPLNPVSFPPPRQSHAHSAHPAQTVAGPPPAPEPIEFDTNPDVLALKSAISVLQMQSKKAKRDMVALQQAKMAALDNTEAFVADLANGHVHMEGAGPRDASSSSSSSDDEDEDEEDEGGAHPPGRNSQPANHQTEPMDTTTDGGSSREPRPWSNLPAAQNIYRCPPINWSQYAVAGDSLDKLHREQQGRPAQGVPATLTPDGRYEFKGVGKQEEFVGVAAPYNPFKDTINKRKPKGPNR